ncbi:MAG: type II secretion system minor pseudopilin GspK [Azonexus sp.]|nr:type II secretion system minor pseudopilin GspK [Azonexus sp.]
MKQRGYRRLPGRQRGVAVVTALLLTTLAVTIVASLFWQQQVEVRSIENQRLQLQTQWILRGALDWTRIILGEDGRISAAVDHLGEPWAVPLAEIRLDAYVDNPRAADAAADARLSGQISDAEGRYNLANLAPNGKVDADEVAVFARLLTYRRQNPALALATARLMAAAPESVGQTVGIACVDDLLAVPGFTPQILAALRDVVIVLPTVTPINANTATAEVLAARIETLSLDDARALVMRRQRVWFRNIGDLKTALDGRDLGQSEKKLAVNSSYFLVSGQVRLDRASRMIEALIERTEATNPHVLWIRENG